MKDKWIYLKFITIFVFTLAMIVWTIMVTIKAGVGSDDDNAFLSDYHKVDRHFNKMIAQNNQFESKYNVKFVFNDEEILGLSYDDVFLAQRVIQERKTRKNIIKIGKNQFKVLVQDKDGNKIENVKVNMLVTKAVTHEYDVKLLFDTSSKVFDIDSIGYWNITGTIEVADEKGYFFIKTNAKK